MKKLIVVAAIAALTMLTGCATATRNYKTGAYAGMAAYNGYVRIIEKMPDGEKKDRFTHAVTELWKAIDSIDGKIIDNQIVAATIKHATDRVYDSLKDEDSRNKLTRDLATLKVIYAMYGNKLSEYASANEEKRDAAFKWLLSFREGVRLMIQLDNGQIFAEYTDAEQANYNVVSPTTQGVINISQSVENIDKEN